MSKRHINYLFLFMTTLFLFSCSSNSIKPSVGVEQELSANDSKEILIKKSLAWAEKKRIDSNSIVKVNYQEDGLIIGTGLTTTVNSLETKNVYRFVMQINIKENGAKIVLNDITQLEGFVDESTSDTVKAVKENLRKIAQSYESAITEVAPNLEK